MQESDPLKFSTYIYEDKLYFIRDGEVFTYDDDYNTIKTDILPSSLEIYGECVDQPMFELKILSIKENDDGSAFIDAEDGGGIQFVFIEKEYNKHKGNYLIGQKGKYEIAAELEKVEIPEDSADYVHLSGDDAKKWFDWVGDEVEEDAEADIGFNDIALFSKMSDFESTANYDFYGMASDVACLSISEEIDEPDPSKTSGFKIPMMNQWNKEEPRFVTASFEYPAYFNGKIYDNTAVKAVLHFVALHGKTNALYKYGTNSTVSPEEKGSFGHSDDEYWEGEDESR